MSRTAQLVLFVTIAVGITAGLHTYLWLRLVRSTALPPPWRAIATGAIIALGVALPLALPLTRLLPARVARVVVLPVYVWMGLMLLLFAFLVLGEAVRLVAAGVTLVRGGAPDPGRRLFLARILGGGAAVAAFGAGAFAMRSALRRPPVRTIPIELARLPPALDGYTIVQLTDLHVGPTLGRAFMEDLVARTNALEPDLVAVTGDLADGSVRALADAVAPLADLRARHGVFFVTGNHEYYSGVEPWLAEVRRLGLQVLRNERVAIGEPDAGFDLAGVDDHDARGLAPGHGPDVERALAGRDPSRFVVLLAHQPREIRRAAPLGVDLQLSGHTHGGQIWPWMFMVYLQQPFVRGLGRLGESTIYVSPGAGFWGPPMRLGAPAEISRIVLRTTGRQRSQG